MREIGLYAAGYAAGTGAPARLIHGKSPFIRRAQIWPRGYPGDFETIEYLVHPINRAAKVVLAGGGVCDYLSDKEVRFLIDVAQRKLLKPGGSIFLTNIATGNPYRPWMEYLVDWFLIERSQEDILQIFYRLGLQDEMIDVQRDKTGLTLMVELTKPCEQEWPPRLSSIVTADRSRPLAQLPQEGERMEKN